MAKNEVTPNVPQIPLDATPSNIPTEPTQLRHMLGWALQAQEPADSILSALATLGLSDAAYKNNLGTPRPSEVMVGLDKSNTYLYLVPVRPNTTGPHRSSITADGARSTCISPSPSWTAWCSRGFGSIMTSSPPPVR